MADYKIALNRYDCALAGWMGFDLVSVVEISDEPYGHEPYGDWPDAVVVYVKAYEIEPMAKVGKRIWWQVSTEPRERALDAPIMVFEAKWLLHPDDVVAMRAVCGERPVFPMPVFPPGFLEDARRPTDWRG